MTPDSEEPLEVPEAALACIGRRSERKCLVTEQDIRRFSQAIGETNAIHFDLRAAREAGYPAIVAPPLFFQALTFEDVPAERLPSDGSPAEMDLPIPAMRAMGGASEFQINRSLLAGEVVTVVSLLRDIKAKRGRSGGFLAITVQTDFLDQTGVLIASEIATYLKRP